MNLMGATSRSGINVTEAKALALSAVWAAIDIKSDVYASFPYKVYRKSEDGKGREVYKDHPLAPLVSVRPNGYTNIFDFQKAKAVHLLKNGNAYVIPKRNASYQIESLFLVPNPNEVTIREHDDMLHYYYKGQHYTADEIIHYKWFSLDGRIGVNPIVYHKDTLALGLAALFFGSDVLSNGAIQPGVLETEQSLKQEDADSMAQSFFNSYGGFTDGKSKMVPVMHSGLKYKGIMVEPDKAQFLGTKQSIIEDVARIFNIPPSIIHHHIQSNYNSSEHQDLTFLKYSMGPFLTRMEMEDKCKLLTEEEILSGDVYFKHNVDSLLRPDFEKRTEGLSKMVQGKIMKASEARSIMDLDWMEEADNLLAPVNTMPADLMAAYYQAKIDALKKGNKTVNENEQA